ncbi:putative abhydrolase domain containing [Cucumis melo var. makuwa]|uniref:Putative abhydrolase domain containing n=1 Tax=Cucumis melo var. makuwa TaxID=1194695 RepID=A0A5D3C5P1_CUCMM|nr:putative abhydrolase domain containing [Cucumis melo var. makuwa]
MDEGIYVERLLSDDERSRPKSGKKSVHLLVCAFGLIIQSREHNDMVYKNAILDIKQTNPKRPCAVLIHCFGGNSKSKWQFLSQVRDLSRCFNLYIPSTNKTDMSDVFQAICVGGLKRLGVEKHSIVGKGIRYGGYVAYRMAEIYK